MAGSVVFLRWLGWLPALTMSVLVTAWTASAVAEPSLSLGKLRWVDLEPKKLAARLDRPAVASDGSSWLTVGEGNGWLSARRFQSDGSPEGDGFQVGATDDLSRDPHLAFDGVDFVLAFQTGDGDRGIGLQRIAPNGLTPVVKLGLHGAWGDIDLAIDDSGTPQVLACDYDYVKSTCASAEVVGQQSTVHPSFDLPFPVIRVDWAFSGGTGLAVVETDAHAVALLDISADGQLLDSRLLDAATGGDALPTLAAT